MTTLFSQNKISEYVSGYTIPECLTQKNVEEQSKTLQGLLSYCDTVLTFLEKNKLYDNVYTLQGPAFEPLLQQFNAYYKKMMVAKKIKTSGLELLRVEQSIHFLTNLSETQNISIYLYLLPEIYDDENIHELILLLSRKYDSWDDQFADQYFKWIYFLAPYSEYLNTIGFDYRKILTLKNTKPDDIVIKHFRSLKERMHKRNIDIDLREEDFGNPKQMQTKLMNLKEVFKGSKINKDNDFYYELGLTSFLVHILNAIMNGDYTFFKICIHTSLCLSNINIPKDFKAFDEPIIFNLKKVIINMKDWKDILSKMLFTIQQEPTCLFNKNSSPLQVVDSLLFLICQAKLKDSAVFLEVTESSDSLLSMLFDTVQIIKTLVEKSESPYYGKYLNYYEYFVMLLLQTAYKVHEELASASLEYEKQLCAVLAKNIPSIIQTKNLRIIVKELCYRGLQLLAQSSGINTVTKNWNFSENSLSDLILLGDPNVSDDLYLNLKYTLKFYKIASGDKFVQDKVSSQDLLDAIYLYIAKIQGDIETWEMPRVKCLGFFFVGLLSVKLPDNAESRFLFLSSFLEFVATRCSLDIWDIRNLQQFLWDALENTENSKEIMLDRSMTRLLETFEDRMAKEKMFTTALSPTGELLKTREVKENIYKMLISSLENTKKNLSAVFFECYPSAIEKSMPRLSSYSKKLIYFTMPWIENFIKTLDPEKSDDDWVKMMAIFQNITLLCFDPVLILFNEPKERKMMRDCCSRIVLHCQYTIGATLQTLYETLRAHLKTMNKELFSNFTNKKNLLQSIRRFTSDTSSSTVAQGYRLIAEDFSYQSICFCSTVLGLYELANILNKIKLQPNKHNLEKNVLKKYKSALEAFSELILNLFSLTESSEAKDEKANETNAELIEKLAMGIQGTIKPLDTAEYSDKVTAHFACNLLCSFLLTHQSPLYKSIVCLITHVIGSSDKETVKVEGKKLLSVTQTWSFVMKNVKDLSSQQVKQHCRYEIDDLVLLATSLKANFTEAPYDTPIQDVVNPYQLEPTPVKFTERLFDEIVQILQSFPLLKLLSFHNDKFVEILNTFLFLFEKSFYNIRKQYDENVQSLSNKLNGLEEEFAKYKKEKEMIIPSKNDRTNPQTNEFGLMGITVKVAGNKKKNAPVNTAVKKPVEKVDPKEIGFQNQILELTQTLEALKQSMSLVEDKFFSNLDTVILVYPFNKIEEYYKTKISSIREDSFSALLNSLERFCNRIITNSSTQESIDSLNSIEKQFCEINTSENEICNNFFAFQAYLQLFKDLLVQSVNEVPLSQLFMGNLFSAATTLLKRLISQSSELANQEDFCAKLENFAHNMSTILLTYSVCQHSQGRYSEDDLKGLNSWLVIIFEADKYAQKQLNRSLMQQGTSLFKDMMNLLQFASSFASNSVIFLNEENSLLKTLLCKENNTPWNISTVSSIAFTLDTLLRGCTPDEIAIEVIIKRALQHDSTELSQLIEHIPKEYQNTEILASILRTKFKLSLDPQNKEQKLCLSIDPSKEKDSPKHEIERVINGLSANAKRLLDLLTISLINNFISNMSQVSEIKNSQSAEGSKYKETSSILSIIALLGHKHPQLLVYLTFNKNDYSSLITSDSSKSPFLNQLNTEGFRSTTFLECLFKIKYFFFHSHDLFILLKTIEGGLGITFIDPENPEIVLDAACLIFNTLSQLMIQDLETRCKKTNNNAFESIENYLALNASVNLLIYLWTHYQKNYTKIVFEKLFKKQVLQLLTKILQGVKWIPEYFYKTLKSRENIQNLLSSFLHEYYETQIVSLSIPQERLNQAKHQSYKDFINCVDSPNQRDNVNILTKLSNTLEMQSKGSESTSKQEILPTKEVANLQNNGLKTPITASSIVSFKQSWAESFSQIISDIQKIIPLKGDSKTFANNLNEENQVLESLAKYLECKRFDLGKENEYVCRPPDLLSVRCTPLFEVKLAAQNDSSDSRTKLSSLLYEKIRKETNLQIEKEDFKAKIDTKGPQDHMTKQQSIKHFFHPTIENQADFESLEKQILIKLKIVSEQISVISLNMPSQNPRDDIVAKELMEIQRHMSEFERKLLVCHLSQFEALKSFKRSDDLPEIKAELSWLKDNFSDYFSLLDRMRGRPKRTYQTDQSPKKALTDNYEPLNPNEYLFGTDYQESLNQIATSEITTIISQNISLFKELYPINDDLVQSLTSFFYIKYEKDLVSSNPATAGLLEELCRSVDFEVKLLDFCMFFLHCPDHLELISGYKYPYSTILNMEKGQLIFNQVYNVVAFNILVFLNNHLSKNDYLIYQPRTYLEKYGIPALAELKAKANYRLKTLNMVSLCDLLVGLQVIPQIAQNVQLSREINNIIFKIFSKERNFTIVELRENDKFLEEINLLTSRSCHTLLKINKIELILRYIPNIMFYSFKEVTHIIENLLEMLYQPVKDISLILKSKTHKEQEKVSKLNQLGDLQSVLDILVEIFSSVSSIMSTKLSTDDNNKFQDQKDDIQCEAIKILGERILHKKPIRTLIKQIFGIVGLLPNLDPTLCQTPLTQTLAKICLNFYALICIEHDYMKSQLLLTDEANSSKSLDTSSPLDKQLGALKRLPKGIRDALSPQKDRGLVFGVHIVNMCTKYRNLIMTMIGESTKQKEQTNGISVIWRHHPRLFDLMAKKKFLMDRISPQVLGARVVYIDRKDLIKTTFQEFANKSLFVLSQGVQVMFAGESGLDAGGLTREFLTIINKELFNPNKGLFQFCENSTNIQPSPISQVTPSHLKYLELAGIMLAKVNCLSLVSSDPLKSIQEECVVDINLTKPLINHILKTNVNLDDLADIDPNLAKNLKWTLSHNVEGLEQSFTYETRIFGQNITQELIPNGHEILVTEENKTHFVKRICQVKMLEEIREQLRAFLHGFHMIIPAEYLALFNASELQAIIAGDPEIDAEEIMKHATYTGYESDPDALIWLMQVLQELTQEQLTAFVFFVTGSLRLPSRNLTEWTIKFKKGGHGANKLPLAHTCSWLIEIPHYTSKEELKQKLVQAIFEGQGSFMRH